MGPGEWLQVYISSGGNDNNGQLFLEECSTPPSIERNPDGFCYTMVCNGSTVASVATAVEREACLNVHRGPSLQAIIVGKLIMCIGEKISVSEKVTVTANNNADGKEEEQQEGKAAAAAIWLRLKNGQGWVSTIGQDGHTVLIQQAVISCHETKNGVNTYSNRSNDQNS